MLEHRRLASLADAPYGTNGGPRRKRNESRRLSYDAAGNTAAYTHYAMRQEAAPKRRIQFQKEGIPLR
jgi:hypothetical protein